MRKVGLFVFALLIYLLAVHNTLGYAVDTVSFNRGGVVVSVEVSQSDVELSTGLMFREGLSPGSGMLFVFDSEGEYGFWMKNVSFPLDIVWLDSNLRVVDITRGVQPCSSDPCRVYLPSASVRYVLEVSAGFAADRGVGIGDFAFFEQREVVEGG
ncbi:hypothetical protein BMS3Abin16_01853 [archaeon BMS3Abin16]|nr:hypothetical protein BMS3Abin16_01853 [archaeon BMS3Abin16]HDY73729.1 DUF192 domain-containing protein [Euryarchaeota archaeon]